MIEGPSGTEASDSSPGEESLTLSGDATLRDIESMRGEEVDVADDIEDDIR